VGIPRTSFGLQNARTVVSAWWTSADAQRLRASCLPVIPRRMRAGRHSGREPALTACYLRALGLCDQAGFTSLPASISLPRLHQATGLRRFSPLFYGSLHRAQFLLDQRCDSCLRFLAGRHSQHLSLPTEVGSTTARTGPQWLGMGSGSVEWGCTCPGESEWTSTSPAEEWHREVKRTG
jgi:hypothetical protein